jgi:hypothetical protein
MNLRTVKIKLMKCCANIYFNKHCITQKKTTIVIKDTGMDHINIIPQQGPYGQSCPFTGHFFYISPVRHKNFPK